MGEGAAAAKARRRSTTGRLSGGHHSKPEDFNRTGRRSDGLTNEEDSKRTGARSNEDVRGTGRIPDDQKILDGPQSPLGDEEIKPEDVEPKQETQNKSKMKCDVSSEGTSADLRSGGGERLEEQTRQHHGACQTGTEDHRGVAVVNLQTVSVSEGGEKEKTMDNFRENNVATQCQVTNRKLSCDICNNATTREPSTIVSVSSLKSLRI